MRAVRKPFVARAHVRIGDERRDLEGGECREIRFAMIPGVRGEQRVARAERREGRHDGQQ